MNEISILIPYKPNHENREAPFQWVLNFYHDNLPTAEICIGECYSDLFSRSVAINNAAKQAKGNIYVIADADVVCNPFIINNSPELLKINSWIIPYTKVLDLTQHCTNILLKKKPTWPIQIDIASKPRIIGKNLPLGGLNIVPRENFEKIGGFDERFKGWGGEDDGFASSMDTLCGPHFRMNENLYHLWHERESTRNNPHYSENLKLARRYHQAYGNPKLMRKIMNEQ